MSEVKPDLPGLQQKLYEKLIPSGWASVLKGFMLSSDMLKLLQQLSEESEDNKKFTPKLSQVFRAFECCPYDKLKLILMGQSPYQFLIEGINVADGIPFSSSNTKKLQPSLLYFHQEINRVLYPGEEYHYRYDLKPWCQQGVLMLNAALTTTIGKTDSHYGLWKPFIVYLMDMLNWNNGGLIWTFIGKKAQEYERYLGSNCYKLRCSHPAAAGHMHLSQWDSEGVFPRIQELLAKQGHEVIQWK